MKSIKTKIKSKTILVVTLIVSTFFIISCDDDTEVIPQPDNNSTKVETIDKLFFEQLKKSMDEYDKNVIWKDYKFSKMPMYYVFFDKNNKAKRGYLINPASKVPGANKIISKDENKGLNIYKFNQGIHKLDKVLKKGNDYFEFYYQIDGKDYYAQKYNEEGVKKKNYEAIRTATHEAYHVFQFNKWVNKSTVIQDEANYPINKDLLALQILSKRISKELPKETNKETLRDYLKMYVAIRSKEMAIDPTAKKLVKNMANEQEQREGTAKYIEVMNALKTLGSKDVFQFQVSSNIFDKKGVRREFAFGIWYDTGAAVTHMLKTIGLDIEDDIKSGKTLYDIAESYLKLTDAQKNEALQKAKIKFKWDEVEKEAVRLEKLL